MSGSSRRARSAALVDRARTALVSDSRRYLASAGVAAVTTTAGAGVLLALGPPARPDRSWLVVGYFTPWVQVCLAYCAITWWVLSPLDGPALSRCLRESTADRRRRQRAESIYGTGGPAGAIVLCGTALAAVLGVALVDDLRERPLVVGLAVAVVASTWLLMVVVYAVHYAREQVNTGGLRFPDGDGVSSPGGSTTFLDFVYLAVQVAASLASSDVAVTRTSMRREVATHTVTAFVFNTVVVALLVSILVSNAG